MASTAFFRAMAICSALAAAGVCVAQLVLTGYPQPETQADLIALYAHPVFIAQSWVILIQVFLMFLALWGAAAGLFARVPALAATGLLVFIFWQALELIPRSIDLFAGSYRWAPAYLAAGEDVVRAGIARYFEVFGDVADAIRDVRSPLWALGHFLFGLAFWKFGGRWTRLIAVLFLFNAARLILGLVGRSVGPVWLAGGGLPLFVIGMVPLFGLLAVWLWNRRDGTSQPAGSSFI